MATKWKINGTAGQPVERKQYLVYGNSNEYASPKWNVMGKRVEDSSAEEDWSEESITDILGDTYPNMKSPITSQSFDSCPVDPGDEYQAKLLQLYVIERNAQSLVSQDLLRVHLYLTDDNGHAFAERFPSSMVKPTGLGGEGGGNLTMPVDVTFGGTREVGYVDIPTSPHDDIEFNKGEPEE